MDKTIELYEILFAYTAFLAVRYNDESLASTIDIVINKLFDVWTLGQITVFLFNSLELSAMSHPDKARWVPLVYLKRRLDHVTRKSKRLASTKGV